MVKEWKKLSSKTVHQNPWFAVTEHKVVKPDGKEGEYFIVEKKPGVVIVAYNGHDIILVNQFRYTFKKRNWELPSGLSDGDDYLSSAKRELKEETGYLAKKWTYLGEFACSPGHSNHFGKVYLAEQLMAGEPNREGGEADMVMKKFSISEIDKMISQGELKDSWTITALYFFKQYLSGRKEDI